MKVNIKPLPHMYKEPTYGSDEAAGADLYAALPAKDRILLKSGETALVPVGFCMELPEGFEAQIRPRSGLAIKDGITVINAPGTVDSDYRGEVMVGIINHGPRNFSIVRGVKIAQMVIAPVVRAKFEAVEELNDTRRGEGGFGSTGITDAA